MLKMKKGRFIMRELCPYASSDDKHSILNKYKSSFEHLGINYIGKAILNIRADLWFPESADIKGTILYYLKGENEPVAVKNTFIDRPYRNINIVSISKRFGRRKVKKGIPIVFDNVDELFKVERIEIIWEIKGFNERVIVDYPVKFEKPQQDAIYSLWTYDKTILSIGNDCSDLEVTEDRLKSNSSLSVYDDFYFMSLYDNLIAVIEELHKPDSRFKIDFNNLENLPLSIVNEVLHKSIEKAFYRDNIPEAVYFYHSELKLNDYTA